MALALTAPELRAQDTLVVKLSLRTTDFSFVTQDGYDVIIPKRDRMGHIMIPGYPQLPTWHPAYIIHIAAVRGNYSGGPRDSVIEYVEDGLSWQRFAYPEPDGFRIDAFPSVSIAIKGDTSFMVYPTYGSYPCMKIVWRVNDSWGLDTVIQPGFSDVFSPDAQVDSSGNLWIFYHQYYSGSHTARCAHQDGGSWTVEIVEDVPSTFWFTPGPRLTIRGTAFALYQPTGAWKQEADDTLRFAWRRPDGTWYHEKLREFSVRGLGVDAGGLVHGLAAFREDSYAHHVVRDTTSPKWDTLEIVDSVNGTVSLDTFNYWFGGYMLVDVDGFLHATYMGKEGQLCYATTSPNVWVSEPPVEPKPSLFLSVSPNPAKGALKLQFGIPLEDEGLVSLKIYDVSGRSVQTVFSEEKSAGYYNLSIPISSFSAGTYFIRLEAETKAKTEKIILR